MLLVSDLDGTLINDKLEIPVRNLKAIKRFKEQGGKFTIATGRSIAGAYRYAKQAGVNVPVILLNGSIIYDYATGRQLLKSLIDKQAMTYAKLIIEHFPSLGAQICSGEEDYVFQSNDIIMQHAKMVNVRYREGLLDDFDGDCYKVLFAGDEALISKVGDFLKNVQHQGVRYVNTHRNYIEMLGESINKGVALESLIKMLHVNIENTCVIGDYYNDFEAISVAGLGATTKEAPQELQEKADLVLCSCNQGCVGALIEFLEDKYGRS